MINLPGSDISITSPKPRREHTAAPSILPSELGYTGQLCHNAVVERGAMFRRRTPGDGFGDQIGVSRQTFHFYGRRGKCDLASGQTRIWHYRLPYTHCCSVRILMRTMPWHWYEDDIGTLTDAID